MVGSTWLALAVTYRSSSDRLDVDILVAAESARRGCALPRRSTWAVRSRSSPARTMRRCSSVEGCALPRPGLPAAASPLADRSRGPPPSARFGQPLPEGAWARPRGARPPRRPPSSVPASTSIGHATPHEIEFSSWSRLAGTSFRPANPHSRTPGTFALSVATGASTSSRNWRRAALVLEDNALASEAWRRFSRYSDIDTLSVGASIAGEADLRMNVGGRLARSTASSWSTPVLPARGAYRAPDDRDDQFVDGGEFPFNVRLAVQGLHHDAAPSVLLPQGAESQDRLKADAEHPLPMRVGRDTWSRFSAIGAWCSRKPRCSSTPRLLSASTKPGLPTRSTRRRTSREVSPDYSHF